jgi:beta-aspartyl-peptidase (threonine type)
MSETIPAIAVHGGAGGPSFVTSSEVDALRRAGVRRAAEGGWRILESGGSALDAVETAVRLLEDDPTFNAGTGACLTSQGEVELDASIMDGETLRCGAVAIVKDVKNPVTLARLVMERSSHVLLAGLGASAFARQVGIPPHDNALLVTTGQRARWKELLAGEIPSTYKGTVGAVARDARGHLAAATSTGGIAMKLPGRIGDTPLIGCGTYADDQLAAVSCTGHGERIIQVTLARQTADLVSRGLGAREAAEAAIRLLSNRVHGEGGLIVAGPRGPVGFAHNTPVMSRAWSEPDGRIQAEI